MYTYSRLYTFDVHCNSFFPMFVLLYGNITQFSKQNLRKRRLCLWLIVSSCVATVVHYFLSPFLITHGFIPLLLSNLLFMVGASYYHYLNFLGYDGKSHKFYCFLPQIIFWHCLLWMNPIQCFHFWNERLSSSTQSGSWLSCPLSVSLDHSLVSQFPLLEKKKVKHNLKFVFFF